MKIEERFMKIKIDMRSEEKKEDIVKKIDRSEEKGGIDEEMKRRIVVEEGCEIKVKKEEEKIVEKNGGNK